MKATLTIDETSIGKVTMSFRTWTETHPKTIAVCKWASIAWFILWIVNVMFYNKPWPWPP